jgi:hypothetical protein
MSVVGEGSVGFELPEVEREKARENQDPCPSKRGASGSGRNQEKPLLKPG